MEAIAEVRRRTSAPMLECKRVLELEGWDVDLACVGLAKARHDASNGKAHDSYGVVALYSHEFGRVGTMVELSCESGYVAKSREFAKLANAIAIHITWSNPKYVDRSQVDPREVETARDNFAEMSRSIQLRSMGVPDSSSQAIDGMMDTFFYPKVCLLDQLEMKETQGTATIGSMIARLSHKTGEKISVRRFVRFKVGEQV